MENKMASTFCGSLLVMCWRMKQNGSCVKKVSLPELRWNYFAVANTGNLKVKTKSKFVNYKVKNGIFEVKKLVALHIIQTIAVGRDRPIYRPIFGFYQNICIGQNGWFYQPQLVLRKHCHIPRACRQLEQESGMNQIKTVILQQR